MGTATAGRARRLVVLPASVPNSFVAVSLREGGAIVGREETAGGCKLLVGRKVVLLLETVSVEVDVLGIMVVGLIIVLAVNGGRIPLERGG